MENKLKKIYFSFGSNHLKEFNISNNLKASIILEVDAFSESEARNFIFNTCIKNKFCTTYSELPANVDWNILTLDELFSKAKIRKEPCGHCECGIYSMASCLNINARNFGAIPENKRKFFIKNCTKNNEELCAGMYDFDAALIDLDKRIKDKKQNQISEMEMEV